MSHRSATSSPDLSVSSAAATDLKTEVAEEPSDLKIAPRVPKPLYLSTTNVTQGNLHVLFFGNQKELSNNKAKRSAKQQRSDALICFYCWHCGEAID